MAEKVTFWKKLLHGTALARAQPPANVVELGDGIRGNLAGPCNGRIQPRV
jgi:hypothetical protein